MSANLLSGYFSIPDEVEYIRSKVPERAKISAEPFRIVLDVGRIDEALDRKFDMRPLLTNPLATFDPCVNGLRSLISDYYGAIPAQVELGFTGDFGDHSVTPRKLDAAMIGHMVRVTGIVTKISLPVSRTVSTVHYTQNGEFSQQLTYSDPKVQTNSTLRGNSRSLPNFTLYSAPPNGAPQAQGEALITQFALSSFQNYQEITLQETPERSPPGQIPRVITVVVLNDLVDSAKPGDRVTVYGIYKATARGLDVGSQVNTFLLANNVEVSTAALCESPDLTIQNTDVFRVFAERHGSQGDQAGDLMRILADSLAPSIHGHLDIKTALMLQLVEGSQLKLDGGAVIRGSIHILLCGDPGTAKSQLLRVVQRLAPVALQTTGRGSSGAGLTAAVVKDKATGGRHLEAGAMVLADRGLLCIDELDKMTDQDRVALHEAMEQQTVSISKAGIQATLNARTCVLAAANPLYGLWDRTRSVAANLALPDTLLSRFDLLFLVLDEGSEEADRIIAEHVIASHRNQAARRPFLGGHNDLADTVYENNIVTLGKLEESLEDNGTFAATDSETGSYNDLVIVASTGQRIRVYARYNPKQHHHILEARTQGVSGAALESAKRRLLVTHAFLRAYVQYVRQLPSPQLTEEASRLIQQEYIALRQAAFTSTSVLPITPRCLDALVRLATAHAKLRLSQRVEPIDVSVTSGLLHRSSFSSGTLNALQSAAANQLNHQVRKGATTQQLIDAMGGVRLAPEVEHEVNQALHQGDVAQALLSRERERVAHAGEQRAVPQQAAAEEPVRQEPDLPVFNSQRFTEECPKLRAVVGHMLSQSDNVVIPYDEFIRQCEEQDFHPTQDVGAMLEYLEIGQVDQGDDGKPIVCLW